MAAAGAKIANPKRSSECVAVLRTARGGALGICSGILIKNNNKKVTAPTGRLM
jgi:hypothetical protein